MKINKKHKHRGELLQQIVAESGLTITFVTKKAGYSRSSYYNHIVDPDLPLEILIEYGNVLKYNFIEEFPEIFKNTLGESSQPYTPESKPDTIEEAIRQLNIWKEKYFELLEKYRAALEQQIKKGM